jgi:hypothetical protein
MPLQDDVAETTEFDVNGKRSKSKDAYKTKKGSRRQPEKGQGVRSTKSGQILKIDKDQLDVRNVKNTPRRSNIGETNYTPKKVEEVGSLDMDGSGKVVYFNMMSCQILLCTVMMGQRAKEALYVFFDCSW